ncbi:hypothetical protein SeMB42_g04196 [Synchytrium endobioticum]|uniref:Pentacotripeptide-repeat region of PRORP domain-containing protein n=1 Tax=Synchytrium endobioticum TaxID=286115 RepID=A0A507D070_9FUNG|nr:hypothetical protein SeMB42_g04196 [Synchytrium endobioticum]
MLPTVAPRRIALAAAASLILLEGGSVCESVSAAVGCWLQRESARRSFSSHRQFQSRGSSTRIRLPGRRNADTSSDNDKRDELDLLDSVLKAPVRISSPASPIHAIQGVNKLDPKELNLHLYKPPSHQSPSSPIACDHATISDKVPSPLQEFNQVIRLNAREKRVKEAEAAFSLINEAGLKPDLNSYIYLATAYARAGMFEAARLQIVKAEQAGYTPDIRAYGILINAFVNAGKLAEAFSVYEYIRDHKIEPTQVIFTTLIKGCINAKDLDRAWKTYHHMRMHLELPDVYTYSIMIQACAKTKDAERALDLVADMTERGVRPDAYSFNCIIAACASRDDYWSSSLELLERMIVEGFTPTLITYKILLRGAALHGDVKRARMIWNDLVKRAAADTSYRPDEGCVISMMGALGNGILVWNTKGGAKRARMGNDGVDSLDREAEDIRHVPYLAADDVDAAMAKSTTDAESQSEQVDRVVNDTGSTPEAPSPITDETSVSHTTDVTESEYPIFERTQCNTMACFDDAQQLWKWVVAQAPAPVISNSQESMPTESDLLKNDVSSGESSNIMSELPEPVLPESESAVASSVCSEEHSQELSIVPRSTLNSGMKIPSAIRISLPVLDSYLSVFCKRPSYSKSPDLAFSVYNTEYAKWGLTPGGYTYQLMLRLVTKASRVPRELRLEIWKQYRAWDEHLESKLTEVGQKLDNWDKEMVRDKQRRGRTTMFRAFVQMILGHARQNELQEALDLIKEARTFRTPSNPLTSRTYLPPITFGPIWNLVEKIRNEAEINANWEYAKQLLDLCPPLPNAKHADRKQRIGVRI